MKKYLYFFIAFLLITTFNITQAATENHALAFAIYTPDPTKASQENWQPVINVMEKTLKKKIHLVTYTNHQEFIRHLKNGDFAITYLKHPSVNIALKQNNNLVFLANAVVKDPISGQKSLNYIGYVITSKNSMINNLKRLKNKKIAYYNPHSTSGYLMLKQTLENAKIQPVTWVKYATQDQVFTAVHDGEAQAMSVWAYQLLTRDDQENYKIIATFKNIPNPALYVNQKVISVREQQQLLDNLITVDGPNNIIGFAK